MSTITLDGSSTVTRSEPDVDDDTCPAAQLGTDILYIIAEMLDHKSLSAIARTCRVLRNVAHEVSYRHVDFHGEFSAQPLEYVDPALSLRDLTNGQFSTELSSLSYWAFCTACRTCGKYVDEEDNVGSYLLRAMGYRYGVVTRSRPMVCCGTEMQQMYMKQTTMRRPYALSRLCRWIAVADRLPESECDVYMRYMVDHGPPQEDLADVRIGLVRQYIQNGWREVYSPFGESDDDVPVDRVMSQKRKQTVLRKLRQIDCRYKFVVTLMRYGKHRFTRYLIYRWFCTQYDWRA